MATKYRIYQPTDVMLFGQNKGVELSEIYHYKPYYIEWLLLNVEYFTIEMESFEKLPSPTPYPSCYIVDEKLRSKMLKSNASLIDKHAATTNPYKYLSVNEMKELLKTFGGRLIKIDYKFPDDVRLANDKKIADNSITYNDGDSLDFYDDYDDEAFSPYDGTYAKDVAGLSDDFINDVFGGEPDAYWNID